MNFNWWIRVNWFLKSLKNTQITFSLIRNQHYILSANTGPRTTTLGSAGNIISALNSAELPEAEVSYQPRSFSHNWNLKLHDADWNAPRPLVHCYRLPIRFHLFKALLVTLQQHSFIQFKDLDIIFLLSSQLEDLTSTKERSKKAV